MRHPRWRLVAGVLAVAAVTAAAATGAFGGNGNGADQLGKINHFVVIYEENHSFDNLYGGWEGVNGPANADAAHTTQVNRPRPVPVPVPGRHQPAGAVGGESERAAHDDLRRTRRRRPRSRATS